SCARDSTPASRSSRESAPRLEIALIREMERGEPPMRLRFTLQLSASRTANRFRVCHSLGWGVVSNSNKAYRPRMSEKIFISYRRSEAQWVAGRLHASL